MTTKIWLLYGEGGHRSQAMRLVSELRISHLSLIASVDSAAINDFDKTYRLKPLRAKNSRLSLNILWPLLFNFCSSIYILLRENPNVLISTGPSVCVFPALVMRLARRRVIFFETWSRFSSRSATGQIMYHIATHFYIQNRELTALYPKAAYCGRL